MCCVCHDFISWLLHLLLCCQHFLISIRLLCHSCLAISSTCISEVFQHVMVPSLLKFSNNFLVNFFPLPISTIIDWSSFLFPRFHRNLLNGLTQAFSLTIHLLLPRDLSKTWIWPYLFSGLIISVYHLPWSSG